MMKVQGHRVSPDEVTSALQGVEGAGEAYVLSEDGGAAGDKIVLYCAGELGDAGLQARLMRHLRSRLPSYMQPAQVRVLPRLPHNANGKVDEAALRGML